MSRGRGKEMDAWTFRHMSSHRGRPVIIFIVSYFSFILLYWCIWCINTSENFKAGFICRDYLVQQNVKIKWIIGEDFSAEAGGRSGHKLPVCPTKNTSAEFVPKVEQKKSPAVRSDSSMEIKVKNNYQHGGRLTIKARRQRCAYDFPTPLCIRDVMGEWDWYVMRNIVFHTLISFPPPSVPTPQWPSYSARFITSLLAWGPSFLCIL